MWTSELADYMPPAISARIPIVSVAIATHARPPRFSNSAGFITNSSKVEMSATGGSVRVELPAAGKRVGLQ